MKKTPVIKTCLTCGKKFARRGKSSGNIYCSDGCGKKRRVERQRNAMILAQQTGIIHGRTWKEHLYLQYKRRGEIKGYGFSLTKEQFLEYWQKPCFYCGSEIEKIGLDRINSSIGYSLGNVLPCCTTCNLMKRKMSVIEYMKHCNRVYSNHNLISLV